MAEPYSEMYDVLLGFDTDLHFENGDLMLTSGIDYITREIYKLLITEPRDWKSNPTIGCSPNRFTGKPNTRETGKRMQRYIKEGLQETVFPGQVEVRVVPTDYDALLIFVDILVNGRDVTTIPFRFSYNNGIKILETMDQKVTSAKSSENLKLNDISNMTKPNKYWTRIREDYLKR